MNTKIKTSLYVIIPIIILGILILVYVLKENSSKLTGGLSDYKLTSKALNLEFLKNDSLALNKYGNRTIELSGVVAATKISHAHGVIVVLDDPMMGIKCVMDSTYKEVPKSIQVGKNVTIKGICAGSDNIVGVMLNKCFLME